MQGWEKNEEESEVTKDRGRRKKKKELLCHLGVGFGPMAAAPLPTLSHRALV